MKSGFGEKEFIIEVRLDEHDIKELIPLQKIWIVNDDD